MLCVEIVDPREQQLVPAGDLWLVDPETGRQVHVDTRRKKIRQRFAQAAAAERDEVRAAIRHAGADHLVLSTAGDWLRVARRAPAPQRGRAARRRTRPCRHRDRMTRMSPRTAAARGTHELRRTDPARRLHPASRSRCWPTGRCSGAAGGSPRRGRTPRWSRTSSPARPGWRRHLPPLLLLLALAALVVALARPQRTVAAPQRAANIIMVTDISGSMNATDVHPDRLTAAVDAAKTLTQRVPSTFRLGLVTFSDYAEQRVAPTTDRAQMKGALDQLVAEGGTAMGDGLERGLVAARTPVPDASGTGVRRLPSVIVLLSDGKNTSGTRDPVEVAREAGRARIPIYAIALGTPARRGRAARLVRLPAARAGAAGHRDAEGDRAASPAAASTRPPRPTRSRRSTPTWARGSRSRSEKREVTASFAGGAIALLIAAGALSLRWFGRLI